MPISKSKINGFFRRFIIYISSCLSIGICNNCCCCKPKVDQSEKLYFDNPLYDRSTNCFVNPIYKLQAEYNKRNTYNIYNEHIEYILSNPMSSIDDKRICKESCGIQRENDF